MRRFFLILAVLLGANASVQAQVAPVTVTSTPISGIPITASPADITGATGGNTPFGLIYPLITNITLTAPATFNGEVFSDWTLNGVAQGVGRIVTFSNANGAVIANAIYTTPNVVLSVQSVNPAAGVVVAAAPPDLKGNSGGTTPFPLIYPNLTVVSLTAPATQGINTFGKWTVNGVDQPAGQRAIRIALAGATTAVATYVTPTFTVAASAIGTHGTINPSGNVQVPAGANQTFTATPAAGYMVNQWTLDGAVAQTGGTTFQLTNVLANHTLTVSFQVILVFHPADTNKDARMTIGEVTAYGAAWMHGKAWPNAPSPIPQAFVTNAILLWKTGELYTYDPSKTQPDSWIPISMAPQIVKPALATQLAAGTSVASITRETGGWWLVNITVTPPQSTRAFTFEEHLPRGAQVSAVSASGVFDQRGLTLRWGPFLDASTRIFSYRIRIAGSGALSGAASFDGSNVNTTGDRSVGGKH